MNPSPASVITCISGQPRDGTLLRAGFNRSKKLGVPWIVLHIDQPAAYSPTELESLARSLANAEAAGAHVIRRHSPTVEEGILSFLRDETQAFHGSAHILIGETVRRLHMPWKARAVAQHIRRRLQPGYQLEIIPLHERTAYPFHTVIAPFFKGSSMRGLAEAVIFVLCATLLSEALRIFLPESSFAIYTHNISLIYLIACAITSIRCGIVPALIASVISFLTLMFFYTPPTFSFMIAELGDAINLLLFLGAAVFISLFGSGTHAYILQAKERERYLQALVNISGTLNRSYTRHEALEYLHREMHALLRLEVAYFLPSAMNQEAVGTVYPPETKLDPKSLPAFEQCWRDYLPTGYQTPYFDKAGWRFEIMMSAQGFVGILGAKVPEDQGLAMSLGLMLTLLADLSASILARIDQTQMMEESRVQEEREKLRSMVLSAVSHDLKTPLASIIGSLDIYHRLHASLTPERRNALTHTAYEEAVRLDSFITNIIDMARLESGKITVNREWTDPVLMVRRIVRKMEGRLSGHRVELHMPAKPFEAEIDAALMEKAITHLLDNAVKYTLPDTQIDITLEMRGHDLLFSVQDHGKGIPEGMEEAIFNKYTRLHKKDMAVAGTGLGLSISRSIAQAHGGSLRGVTSGNGALFTIELPGARPLAVAELPEEAMAS